MPSGMRLEFDSAAFAREWNPGGQRRAGSTGCVLFFGVASRDDVDCKFAALTTAGYVCQKAPEDAFCGARYAIVEDPDGNAVGIMSPTDVARHTEPPPPPQG